MRKPTAKVANDFNRLALGLPPGKKVVPMAAA